jgi:hypothetical protein
MSLRTDLKTPITGTPASRNTSVKVWMTPMVWNKVTMRSKLQQRGRAAKRVRGREKRERKKKKVERG